MQFTATVLLLLSAAGGLMAFPSVQPNATYVELYREKTSNGSLVYLGASQGSNIVSKHVPNAAYVELYREKTSNGSLVYLGPSQGSNIVPKDVPALEERGFCETQPIACGNHHQARNDLCDKLVTELFADPTISVGSAPRQICFEAEAADNFCCVSWSNVIPNLTKGDLADSANIIMQQCTANGISGKRRKVLMEGFCANVCLSDRGTGCS